LAAKSRIPWRSNQASALGSALSYGKDVGYRCDLIILAEDDEADRAISLAEEAMDLGLRPALLALHITAVKDVKWPPGVPVYLVPPDSDERRKEVGARARQLLGLPIAKHDIRVWWAEGQPATTRRMGFRSGDEGEIKPE
jgi:hypothetical protein